MPTQATPAPQGIPKAQDGIPAAQGTPATASQGTSKAQGGAQTPAVPAAQGTSKAQGDTPATPASKAQDGTQAIPKARGTAKGAHGEAPPTTPGLLSPRKEPQRPGQAQSKVPISRYPRVSKETTPRPEMVMRPRPTEGGFQGLFKTPAPEPMFDWHEPAPEANFMESLLERDLPEVERPTTSRPRALRPEAQAPPSPAFPRPAPTPRSTASTPHLASAVTPGPAAPPIQKETPPQATAQPARPRPVESKTTTTPPAATPQSEAPGARANQPARTSSMRSKPRLNLKAQSEQAAQSGQAQTATGRMFIKAAPVEAIDGIKGGKSSQFAATWAAAASRPKETPRKTLSGLSFSERMDELDPLEDGLPLRPKPEFRPGEVHPESLLRYISHCCECGFKILQRLYLCLQCASEERVVVMQSEVRFARDGFYFRSHSDAVEFSPLARQLFAEGGVEDVLSLRRPPMYPQFREMLALGYQRPA